MFYRGYPILVLFALKEISSFPYYLFLVFIFSFDTSLKYYMDDKKTIILHV